MNELQRELKNQLARFSKEKIEPFMEEDDKNEHFRMEIFHELGELGFCGITTPEKYSGAGLTYHDFTVALTQLAKSSPSYAVTISVSTMVQGILNKFATDHQKEKYLPSLANGEEIGSFCLSESSSGSDAGSLLTTAKKVQGGYILNGTKMWVTSGGLAKTYIVMARTGEDGPKGISAFIVRDETKGLSYGKKENKIGWKVSPTREVILSDCFVPDEDLLAKEGLGFKIAMEALDAGRITIGAIAVGISQRALDEAVRYSLQRQQFKQAIFDFQGLQFMMADMATEAECSRLLVEQAAILFDGGKSCGKLSSMAKLKATDTCMKVTIDAVQILGGVGHTSEYPVERFMRDAKILQLVEGTNQIQRVVIARKLKSEYL